MDDDTFAWCLFSEADADGSGGLDRDEIKALSRQLGYPLSAADLNTAMAEMDTGGGGTVEFDEFLAWFQKVQEDGTEQAGGAKLLLDGAKDYMMKAAMGRDTGHGFQYNGGLADRLKAAEEKRGERGAYQCGTIIALNSPDAWHTFGSTGADVVQRTAESLAGVSAAPEPEPEPEPEPAAGVSAEPSTGLGSISARWNAAAPPAFWSFPWDLSDLTASLASFVEQPKPEESPLDRLSGRVDRALVVAVWSNGDVYEGEWGRGEVERVQEALGVWKSVFPPLREMAPDGVGAHVFADGSVYVGEWKLGQRHGQGRMKHAAGDCYTGHFKHDKYHGSGMLEHANGSKFKGAFGNGLQHGSGTFTLADGTKYCADFKEGRAYQFRPFADGGKGDFDYVDPGVWQSACLSSWGGEGVDTARVALN